MQLPERDMRDVLLLRADRAGLQASKAYPHGGLHSHGTVLRDRGCPCGHGQQTRAHMLWGCQLRHVVRIRQAKLAPACQKLGAALDAIVREREPAVGYHAVAAECNDAIRFDTAPGARRVLGVLHSAEAMQHAALRQLLGLVRLPDHVSERDMRTVRAAARPVLCAVLDMLRYTEAASAKATAAAAVHSRNLRLQAGALDWLRAYTWANPRPPGGPCRCCVPRTLRAQGGVLPAVHMPALTRARALTDTALRWELAAAASTAHGAPQVTQRLQLRRNAAEAALTHAEAQVVEALAQQLALPAPDDPVVPAALFGGTAPMAAEEAERRAALTTAMQGVRKRRHTVACVSEALQWWPKFVARSMALTRKRATQRARMAAAATRVGAVVRTSAPPLTARQRAEREETARRKQREEAAARATLLRRRVLANIRAREAAAVPASAQPLAAVELARAEAARRGGSTQAIGASDGTGARESRADTVAPPAAAGATVGGKRRGPPSPEESDARATAYARYIL